jgi:hypothetical protein
MKFWKARPTVVAEKLDVLPRFERARLPAAPLSSARSTTSLQFAEKLDVGWRSAFSAAIKPYLTAQGFSP